MEDMEVIEVMEVMEVIDTVGEEDQRQSDQSLSTELDWLQEAAAQNPVFAFLHDSEEDIYTLEDGKAIDDEVALPQTRSPFPITC
jgi:hypothetical protein